MISSMLSRCFCLWTVSGPCVPERFWDGRTLSCFHHQAGQRARIFRSLIVIGLVAACAFSALAYQVCPLMVALWHLAARPSSALFFTCPPDPKPSTDRAACATAARAA